MLVHQETNFSTSENNFKHECSKPLDITNETQTPFFQPHFTSFTLSKPYEPSALPLQTTESHQEYKIGNQWFSKELSEQNKPYWTALTGTEAAQPLQKREASCYLHSCWGRYGSSLCQTVSKHAADLIHPWKFTISVRHKITHADESDVAAVYKKKKKPTQNTHMTIITFFCFNTFLEVTACSFASAAGKYRYYWQKTLTSRYKNLGTEGTAGKRSGLPSNRVGRIPSLTTLEGRETLGKSFCSSSRVSTSAASKCCCFS